jgi:ABC-type transport system involved in Fe-S cluster assembly fused permease/ATPase subunit
MRTKSKAVDFVMNETLVNYESVKYFNNERLEN